MAEKETRLFAGHHSPATGLLATTELFIGRSRVDFGLRRPISSLPPLPGRHPFGIGQRPESRPPFPGQAFVFEQRDVGGILPVNPGVAFLDHFAIDVAVADIDASKQPPVSVFALRGNANLTLKDLVRHCLPRPVAPGLPPFRGIDLRQPQALLLTGARKFAGHGNGVAVVYADHQGFEAAQGIAGVRHCLPGRQRKQRDE